MSGADEPSEGRARGGPPAEPPGVLGSLPRTRPGVRSPRRERPDVEEDVAEGPEAEQRKDAEARPRGPEAELESLARAGASLAGETATLGLRVAGRAAAALRDAVERR